VTGIEDGSIARKYVGPTAVDGALVRLMTDGTTVWVEQWNGERWIPGRATVREVLMGLRARKHSGNSVTRRS
jgi:hypothetical protein